MALNFPDNPIINQVYSDSTSGFYYKWDGNVWQSYSPSSSGNIKILDDISSQFTGIGQTFALTTGGVSVIPINVGQLVINLGGVVQNPGIDYTVSSSNITFTTPPGGGLSFSGISLGPAVPLTNLPSASVTPDKLSTGAPWWQPGYKVGIGTTLPTSALNVIGDGNFTGVITATTFNGNATSAYYASIAGYSTNAVSATNALYAGIATNVSGGIASVTSLNVSGISTLGQTIVGGATTQLVVQGNARITGILTIGTASITFDGTSNTGTIGTTRIVSLASGIKTLFHEATAPTGWTKVTTHDNKALRVVSGTGGGSGGSVGFTTAFTSKIPTGTVSGSNSGGSVSDTTLTEAQIPSHTHAPSTYAVNQSWAVGGSGAFASSYGGSTSVNNAPTTGATGSSGAHGHGFTNPTWSGSFSGTAIDFSVQYVDIILCSIN